MDKTLENDKEMATLRRRKIQIVFQNCTAHLTHVKKVPILEELLLINTSLSVKERKAKSVGYDGKSGLKTRVL